MYLDGMKDLHGRAIAEETAIDIRQRMSTLRISQWKLANALGVSQGALSQWLRGLTPIPIGMEARIHAALDVLEEEHRVAAEAVQKLRAERAAQEVRDQELQEQV